MWNTRYSSFDFFQLFKNVKPILNAGHTEASGGLDLTIRQCPIPSFTEQKKEQKKVSVLRTWEGSLNLRVTQKTQWGRKGKSEEDGNL